MYPPARPRPRKTSITRSRSGCEACRQRHKKCDEQRPQCKLCQRLGQSCNYSQSFHFRNISITSNPAAGCSSKELASTNRTSQASKSETNDPERNKSETWACLTPPDANPVHLNKSSTELHAKDHRYYIGPSEDTIESAGIRRLSVSAVSLQEAAARINSDNSLHNTRDLLLSPILTPLLELVEPFNITTPGHTCAPTAQTPTTSQAKVASVTSDTFISGDKLLSYSKAWQEHCVPCLPPVLKYAVDVTSLPPAISWSALALSACHLSRIQPQRDQGSVRPNRAHWIASQQLYCSAIRDIVSWKPTDKRQDVGTIIQAILLLCFLELASGNFAIFQLHSEGIQTLIKSGIEAICAVNREGGIKLLQAWVQTKLHNWWRRVHFGTPRFLLFDVSFKVEPRLQAYLNVENARRTSILTNLCESYRLSLSLFVSQSDEADILGVNMVSPETNISFDSSPSKTSSENLTELSYQSQLLNSWHSYLCESDLPIDKADGAVKSVNFPSSGFAVKPLYFNSHAAAMNYAYYSTARIIQAVAYIETLPSSILETGDSAYSETEYWSLLLLRIAAGIDWTQCLDLNPFTIGLSGLFLASSLCCSNPDAVNWMQSWIGLHCNEESPEEGSFPISQVWRTLCLVNEERAKGFDVLAVFQPSDDEGRPVKHDSYQCQSLEWVRILCRNRTTGSIEVKRTTI